MRYVKYVASLARAFLRAPKTTGAILPSSIALASRVVAPIQVDASTFVVELGVGSGSITRAIFGRGVSPAQYMGIEMRADLLPVLRARFPEGAFIEDAAENLPRILARSNLPMPSSIVASLPWSLMPRRTRLNILEMVATVLRPDGDLLSYTYLSNAFLGQESQRVLHDFRRHFIVVQRSPPVWTNIPPAFAWRCQNG